MSIWNLFCLPLCWTTSYYTSFIPSTIKLWNELEADLKISPSLSILGLNLKELKFQKPKCTLILEIDEKILLFVNYGIKLVIWMLTYRKIIWPMIHIVYIVAMNLKDLCIISLNAQNILSKEIFFYNKFVTLVSLFRSILNGSSEYLHNLNCKIISYVHN